MQGVSGRVGKEFPMTDSDFQQIQDIAYKLTGIKLTDHKREMVYSRLARRIRPLGLSSFKEYCKVLESRDNNEVGNFINSITTNLTSFFRENHHFEFLHGTVIPELKRKHSADKRIRIWSAGCSTGEEPHSISMTLTDHATAGWDMKVLATDLDSEVVAKAKSGCYEMSRVEGMEDEKLKRWFVKDRKDKRFVKVKDTVRERITFKQLNLLEPWPMKGPFDVIFCRNVVIYFDKPTQKKLFNRYADMLAPGGYLFIGHSESLHRVTDRFESLGKTMYRKVS